MKIVAFRCLEEDHERWREEATKNRISFGEWVRRKLNSDLPLQVVVHAPRHPRIVREAVKVETPCSHRIPPGTWCKRCSKIRK